MECQLTCFDAGDGKLFLAHVIPSHLFQFVSPELSEETLVKAKEYASAELRELVESVSLGGLVHEEILGEGQVWPVLQGIIKEKKIDLVAIGTHGRTSKERLLLGAVAEEIFRTADCALLSVGPEVAGESGKAAELQRLLYATNFKPHAERAASFAYAFERDHPAHLTVLHVVESPENSQIESHEIVREFLMNRMRKGIPEACMNRCEPELMLRFGEPAQEILRAAQEGHSDLIVLGLRAAKRLAGHLPSATAYRHGLPVSLPCPDTSPIIHQIDAMHLAESFLEENRPDARGLRRTVRVKC